MYSLMIRKGMLSRQESIARVEVESQEDRVLLPGAVRDILARLGMAQEYAALAPFWSSAGLPPCGPVQIKISQTAAKPHVHIAGAEDVPTGKAP